MKLRIISLVSAIAVMITAFTIAVTASEFRHNSAVSSAETTKFQEQHYMVRIDRGKITVFGSKSKKVEKVLDVNVASLPLKEQQRLQKGIQINTETELLELIENYTS